MIAQKENIKDYGLVLEGGAMRGVFTCGVLDWMMDNGLHFPYVVGVSAGACNGASYISGQRGRAKYSNIDLFEKYRYVGLKYYVRSRNILDFDLLFDDFPNKIIPFDFEAYRHSGKRFESVVSNCLTGRAEYMEEYGNDKRLLDILKASSSMPVFSPIAYVDNTPMLDGGVCDSIPLERAIAQGYGKNVVVLTRNKSYRKKKTVLKMPSFLYKDYPLMREAVNNRNEIYNAQLDLIDRLEEEGQITVVRPIAPMTIDRLEKDVNKLTYFYDHGYECAEQMLKGLF
ncbi:putative patatin/cPLA2 family phospholipase [Dysgonomonas sp. PH5-45]|uniref:patatin-like phospholipase family protein n=1 Tax=unclassified Dysgonomonas TaxID=2630389 RepID=UPI002476FDEA|nr:MULTISPECIES: patatin family protein [unclassified Dysgonomonas]MDH6353834.1 putative patatin/cPLA2 family phospholipase [Dysgonomonas sp. PH5-45]MDH6386736.1 putative patatin/cPLA2 family phospholipase [Dysgonomonas sp. PH5-37]